MTTSYTAPDGNTVHFDKCFCSCTCPSWNIQSNRFVGSSGKFPPFCTHIARMLTRRADHVFPGLVNIILIPRHDQQIAMNVKVTDKDSDRLYGVDVFYRINKFVGYVTPETSRMDIRDMLWPMLLAEYSERICTACQKQPQKLSRPLDIPTQRMAVYEAAYLTIHGKCPTCDDSDLIPDASPEPPKVVKEKYRKPAKMDFHPKITTTLPAGSGYTFTGSEYTSTSPSTFTSSFTTMKAPPPYDDDDLPF